MFDELLAPTFQGDRAASKAFASALDSAIRQQIFEIVDLVAEGDAVVARFNYRVTVLDGTTTKARGYVHFRFADRKIASQDVITDPDLTPLLAQLVSPPTDH